MLNTYLRSSLRQMRKRKVFSLINIFGLAIGMAACLLLLQYVTFELSYDTFHKNKHTTYRLASEYFKEGQSLGSQRHTGSAYAPTMYQEIPGIASYVRMHPMYFDALVNYTNELGNATYHVEPDMYFADSTFFEVFSYDFVSGNPQTALDKPGSIVLTQRMVEKYFGSKNADVLGKLLKIEGGWADGSFIITGIIKDVPENSHLQFDFMMPMADILANDQYQNDDGWGWTNFYSYIQLQPNTDPADVSSALVNFVDSHMGEDLETEGLTATLFLEPLTDIHLHSTVSADDASGKASTVYFFALIGVFILVIAWVNYINLSTARGIERAREVGVRKSLGANRSQLVRQFLTESFVMNLIALGLSIVLALFAIPFLRQLTGKAIGFEYLANGSLWLGLVLLFMLGSVLSGLYPAFVLSRFKPVEVLKGTMKNFNAGFNLRQGLVVFQFMASMAMVIGTYTVYQQINYMRQQDLGMELTQVLPVKGPKVVPDRERAREALKAFKNDALTLPAVQAAATASSVPGRGFNWNTSIHKVGDDPKLSAPGHVFWSDPHFHEVYGLELLSGRFFFEEANQNARTVLVNEHAIKAFALGNAQEALQHKLILGGDTLQIVGVVKEFNWLSLHTETEAILLAPAGLRRQYISLKVNAAGNLKATLAQLQKNYENYFPGNPFTYFFADDEFNRQYESDIQFGQVFLVFAGLAIFVACLGLFGLASFTAIQRTKEISIRKVLGAPTGHLVWLLCKFFLRLVVIAAVLASIPMYYLIDTWLTGYAFRININVLLFVWPTLLLLLIAILTISLESYRAASTDPVKSLRSE